MILRDCSASIAASAASSSRNVLLLWSECMARGFSSSTWMTFRQALELGACVRKGETGSMVVYANRISKIETDGEGREVERDIPFLKAYTVFNVEQIDGLPKSYAVPSEDNTVRPVDRIAHADAFFAATGALIRHGGDKAFYAPAPDYMASLHFCRRANWQRAYVIVFAGYCDPRGTRSALSFPQADDAYSLTAYNI
ncbi:antirestriction protein ArdC [Rhizobium pisi]|uniref:Antirestriction protein ArdC n=1 Tax=Rhizobium pisi TaxID=574561 RepID=A0A427MXC5_9HYPH|nr:antirestriction protein ArdC [Rhizobium pisi]RSB75794.1 DUF1738 domain-containing protein [Rhizobium pisi]